MAHLGEAVAAELDALLGRYVPAVSVPRGFVSPKPQASYLVGQLGAGPAAAMLGVTTKTLRKWLAGATPTKANRAKLDQAYHRVRDPRARKAKAARTKRATQQRLIKALTTGDATRIQISGTVIISDDERFVENFGGTPEIPPQAWVEIVDLWQSGDTDQLGDVVQEILREVIPSKNGGALHFSMPDGDVEFTILLTLAED